MLRPAIRGLPARGALTNSVSLIATLAAPSRGPHWLRLQVQGAASAAALRLRRQPSHSNGRMRTCLQRSCHSGHLDAPDWRLLLRKHAVQHNVLHLCRQRGRHDRLGRIGGLGRALGAGLQPRMCNQGSMEAHNCAAGWIIESPNRSMPSDGVDKGAHAGGCQALHACMNTAPASSMMQHRAAHYEGLKRRKGQQALPWTPGCARAGWCCGPA